MASRTKTSEAQPLDGALRFSDFPVGNGPSELQVLSPKDQAASPDAFVRTPLFGASEKSRTLLLPGEELVVINDEDGYQVMLCGGLRSLIAGPYGLQGQIVSGRFDQTDYTVYLGLLRYMNGHLGRTQRFEPYAFVRELGLADTRENVYTVFASIARMAETRVGVRLPISGKPGKFEYLSGRLVSSVGYNGDTGEYWVGLDAQLGALFRPGNFSGLAWADRLAIKGALAKWLHAELASHESGRFRWTHKLQEAYGSKSPARVFKARLKEAAEEVSRVTGWRIAFEKSKGGSNEKLVCLKNKGETLPARLSSQA